MDTITMLVVDDSQSFLGMVTRFLERSASFEIVGAAQNRADALEKARTSQPQIVLLDLSMPEQNGLEMIQDLRQVVPNVGIVVLTLWDMEAYRQAAFALGADEFVSKVTLRRDLLPAIQRLAQRLKNADMQPPAETSSAHQRTEEHHVDL